MDIRKTISKNLRACRKSQGITQEKLAELSGFSRQYISKIERAGSNIGIQNIECLCDALNIEIVQLFAEFDERGYLIVRKPLEKSDEDAANATQDCTPSRADKNASPSENDLQGSGASVVFQEENGILQSFDIPFNDADLTFQTMCNLQQKGYRGDYLTVRLSKMLPELKAVYKKYA